jgi:hypothetical protein
LEGVDLDLPEGWHGDSSALHQIAFTALPDAHSVVGLQHCRTVDHRTYLAAIKGLHLNLPNDLFNGFERRLATAEGEVMLGCPPISEQVVDLCSPWANVDGRLGVVGLYGAEQLVVHQSPRRLGGRYASLYVDEICYPCELGTRSFGPNTVILDVGWAVLSNVGCDGTRRLHQSRALVEADIGTGIRGVIVRGLDGHNYAVVANFSNEERHLAVGALGGACSARDLATGKGHRAASGSEVIMPAGQSRVLAVEC